MVRKNKRSASGYIFVCTTKTKAECFRRSLFGSGKAYGASVLKIREGDILFLNDLSSNTLLGIFKASSNGELNIEPDAWGGKFPYQVRFNKLHKTVKLKGVKKILKKIDFSANTILVGDKLGYLLDLFAYRGASLDDLFIDRSINLRDKTATISNDDTPFIEATTLWNFSKQSYGLTPKGDSTYSGVTPALVLYNLIWRYTEPGDLVVDPMCGSGTTIDVCREESRKVRGFDISPIRRDIKKADARSLPIKSGTVDMVFIDSPYGDNIDYNEDPNNLGKISSQDEQFYCELEKVMIESKRILRPGKILAWLISDYWENGKFIPVGFRVYERLCNHFEPIDIVCLVRRGQTSHTEEWFNRARRLNFYLRGFKYLIIVKKPYIEIQAQKHP
jgi:DNA modification methylase